MDGGASLECRSVEWERDGLDGGASLECRSVEWERDRWGCQSAVWWSGSATDGGTSLECRLVEWGCDRLGAPVWNAVWWSGRVVDGGASSVYGVQMFIGGLFGDWELCFWLYHVLYTLPLLIVGV